MPLHNTFSVLRMVRKFRMDNPEMTLRNVSEALLISVNTVELATCELRKSDKLFKSCFPKYSHPIARSLHVNGIRSYHPIYRVIIDQDGRREGYYNADGTRNFNVVKPLPYRVKALTKKARKAEKPVSWAKWFKDVRDAMQAAAASEGMLRKAKRNAYSFRSYKAK
jgi:hypothetical protein